MLQDKPDSVQDALSVMEAYGNQEYEQEIYLFKCRDLIHKNKVSSSESLCPVRYMYAYSTYILEVSVGFFS